jgi:hypothetical protein
LINSLFGSLTKDPNKDPKNPHRVRITCKDENEHGIVKRVAETKLAPGAGSYETTCTLSEWIMSAVLRC